MTNGLNSITNSVKSGGTKIKNIVSALGITKIISTAMNTIMNSIDGAVSRIDTLNNFPKVMNNLGIASEDSEKAINKLSDGLQGIPTKLDDAALAVQRFTSKNGDVDKSVDLFLAVNNALLAGGASAEIQSSAMEQLSQAYAKGKPDMIEWRSIQTAMPAQLKQISQEILGNTENLDLFLQKAQEYADSNPLSASGAELVEQLKAVKEGSGDMTTALGTALRLGIISMDDFLDTIVKLNKEGTGEFLSLEEQAKNATGGIKTSITNAKTAITRGVGKIIEAFDKMLKDNGLGGISEVINNIGKTSEKVLNKVASLIPKVVSKVKDIWNWIKKNKEAVEKLIIVIASLTAGYLAYKAVLVAINAIQIVKNITGTVSAFLSLIPAIKSAKDAMLLLNMAFNVNPIGLVVAAVTALVGGLILLNNTQQEGKKEAEEFAESMASAKKSMEEYDASIDEAMNKELAHIDNVKALRDELTQLVDENGKVKEGYKSRVDFILNELNKALGTEYKLNGDVIESYKDLQEEIDSTIEKKRAELILKSKEEKYTNAINEGTKAVVDLKTARENLGMTYEDAKKKVEDYYTAVREGTISADEALSQNKDIEALKEYITAYEDAEGRVKQCVENRKDYESNYALFVEGKYDEIGQTVVNTTKNWINSSIEEIQKGINTEQESLNKYKELYETTGSEVALQQQKQAEENLKNLANELIARTTTIGDLGLQEITAWQTLANNSYDVYKEAINKMSPEMQGEIQRITGVIVTDTGMVSETSGQAEKMTTMFKQKLELSGKTDEEIGKICEKLENDTTVEKAAGEIAEDADRGFNNNVDGFTWGKDLTSNISSGMISKLAVKTLRNAASTIATNIKNIIGHSVPKEGPLKDELTYMPDMINNLVKGIEKNKYKVAGGAGKLADDLKDNFNLDELNNKIVQKMNRAVEIETNAINTDVGIKAIIREENRKPRTVNNDNGTVINNTQNFYEKDTTPYEQQKQAKQQLRRLAYGL